MRCAELEIELERRRDNAYAARLRFSHPESDADVQLGGREPDLLKLDPQALLAHAMNAEAYGKALGEALAGSDAIRDGLSKSLAAAESLGTPLRIRLAVSASSPELHDVRWETLWLPGDLAPLLAGGRAYFSRYLSSGDWRPVMLRPRTELHALIAVANPKGLDEYAPGGQPLAPLNPDAEVARARNALGGIQLNAVPGRMSELTRALESGPDLLFLVCHGALVKGEPVLWMEDDSGAVDRVSGKALVEKIRGLSRPPRLVVLASCESAGRGFGHAAAMTALGPQLAEAGAAAVLAMQGKVSIDTAHAYTLCFFEELGTDGRVDRAASVARAAVRDAPDWWMPALFMRLKSGRLWYRQGFSTESDDNAWDRLLRYLDKAKITPILGPGMATSILGLRNQLARQLAERHHFPMAVNDAEILSRVAQYLAAERDDAYSRDAFMRALRTEAMERGKSLLDDPPEKYRNLTRLLRAVWERTSDDPDEPHRLLARLPLPIFITVNPDDLMTEALKREGKKPRVDRCLWSPQLEGEPLLFEDEPDYLPSVEEPLVYHLFGWLDDELSLVLTEDDHFEFLMGFARNAELIPPVVREALARSSLLFLGFDTEDWAFRLLMRCVRSPEGGRRRRYTNVAAQLDPREDHYIEPDRAREHLDRYLGGERMNLYWGPVEAFLAELVRQWEGETS